MKQRLAAYLLAKIGGRVHDEPTLAVRADGDRRLRRRQSRWITSSRAPARLAVGIPLRKTAARRRAENQHADHGSPCHIDERNAAWPSEIGTNVQVDLHSDPDLSDNRAPPALHPILLGFVSANKRKALSR